MDMALARKPLIDIRRFNKFRPDEQRKEIRAALESDAANRLNVVETGEGHAFVPCDEKNKPKLTRLMQYHGAETQHDAIRRAVTNYILGKNTEGLVDVATHEHEGKKGFKVTAKKG